MRKPTLWILGSSNCLPYNLEDTVSGWPEILSQQLKMNCVNLSQVAVDNFFIYNLFLENRAEIQPDDIVIIGWTHYSRKSFILDRDNHNQLSVLKQSLLFKTKKLEFIRNNNSLTAGIKYWMLMKPINRGIKYYDNWFKNYYSEYEQKFNLQSYIDSVTLSCAAKVVSFFYSEESIADIDISQVHDAGCFMEFVMKHNVSISPTDGHFNELGHVMWADQLTSVINNT